MENFFCPWINGSLDATGYHDFFLYGILDDRIANVYLDLLNQQTKDKIFFSGEYKG